MSPCHSACAISSKCLEERAGGSKTDSKQHLTRYVTSTNVTQLLVRNIKTRSTFKKSVSSIVLLQIMSISPFQEYTGLVSLLGHLHDTTNALGRHAFLLLLVHVGAHGYCISLIGGRHALLFTLTFQKTLY